MFKYRAKEIDTNRIVKGYYLVNENINEHKIHYNIETLNGYSMATTIIDPGSLSVSTGLMDIHGIEIYGSFPYNDETTQNDHNMSKGGDVVLLISDYQDWQTYTTPVEYTMEFKNGSFCLVSKDRLISRYRLMDYKLEIVKGKL